MATWFAQDKQRKGPVVNGKTISNARAIVAASMIALITAGCGSLSPAAPDSEAKPSPVTPDVKLYALDCGRIEMLDLDLFDRGGAYEGRQNSAVDTCFLIRHPNGDLMWDAGLPDGLNALPDGLTQGAFTVSVPTTLASQLDALGVPPAEIDYFSISHSHFDHVGNANLFAGATFLVTEAERAHMFRDEARANTEGFADYKDLEASDTLTFTGDYDVFGDGSVTILSLPGHTPGHTALMVRLVNEGTVLLSGDLYHLEEARELRTVPRFNTDAEETLRSMDRFEDIAAQTGARVVIQHGAADFEALPQPPAYLD